MGWEERGRGSYYYRKERGSDGRVRSIYAGSGWAAQLEARYDQLERAKREGERCRLSSIREEWRELSEAYRTLANYVRVNVSAALTLEGYRCHKRQWRRRRYPLPPPEPMPAKKKKKPLIPEGRVPVEITFTRAHSLLTNIDGSAASKDAATAEALIKCCNTNEPNPVDLAALRKWMRRDGAMLSAEELSGAVALKAVSHYENAFLEEAILSGHADMIRSMGYAEADPVEGLLILQTATAWLLLHTVQEKQARLEGEGGQSLNVMEALSKRVDRAHHRFTKATETLEKIRALRRMTEYRKRPRMLVKAEREALTRHYEDEGSQPAEDAEFAVVGG